jgi:hypothetical protein
LTLVNDDQHHIKEDYTMSTNNRTPDQDSPETATGGAEPSAPDASGDQRSFAERVGRRKPVSGPDPFEIAVDVAAGVRLFESKRDRQVAIKFGEGRLEDKPSQAVIDKMKEAGFRWDRTDKIWARPLTPESSMSVRIEAERLYQEVRGMIRQEKGIATEQGGPF